MSNLTKRRLSSSSSSINLYQFFGRHFFLLFGITYLSIITIAAIGWGNLCPVSKDITSYSAQSTSTNTLAGRGSELTGEHQSAQAPSHLGERSLAEETSAGSHRFYGGVPLTNQNSWLIWLYTVILLGCTATPWLLAYMFRYKAFSIVKKPVHNYSSSAFITVSKPKPSPTPNLPKAKVASSCKPNVSYRITSFKTPPTMKTSVTTKKRNKNIRLPFEQKC